MPLNSYESPEEKAFKAHFLVLAHLGPEHPGIVYCKQNTRSIGEIIAGLELIWELCEPAEMQNRV